MFRAFLSLSLSYFRAVAPGQLRIFGAFGGAALSYVLLRKWVGLGVSWAVFCSFVVPVVVYLPEFLKGRRSTERTTPEPMHDASIVAKIAQTVSAIECDVILLTYRYGLDEEQIRSILGIERDVLAKTQMMSLRKLNAGSLDALSPAIN